MPSPPPPPPHSQIQQKQKNQKPTTPTPPSTTNTQQQRRASNSKKFQRSQSAVILPNSSLPHLQTLTHNQHDTGTQQFMSSRRRTVALDKGIQLRKTFHEWLESKTEDNRRRSLNTIHAQELERLRAEQIRRDRFSTTKTYTEWKSEKEEIIRHQVEETRQKAREEIVKQAQKKKEAEELRVKKYDEWLVKKFQAELAEEEKKIEELRLTKDKLKKLSKNNKVENNGINDDKIIDKINNINYKTNNTRNHSNPGNVDR